MINLLAQSKATSRTIKTFRTRQAGDYFIYGSARIKINRLERKNLSASGNSGRLHTLSLSVPLLCKTIVRGLPVIGLWRVSEAG
jgi:hypothetical protein